jgi:predicted transcriptional regulator
MAKRFTVTFSDAAYQTLEELSEIKAKPMSEVLRDALALEGFVEKEQREGHKILIDRNGQTRELIPR